MQTIFNLQSRLRVHHVAVFVCVGDGRAVTGVRKPQSFWRRREQPRFETWDRLVYQVIDWVDNIIYERLWFIVSCKILCLPWDSDWRAERMPNWDKTLQGKTHQGRVAEVLSEQGSGRVIHLDRNRSSTSIFSLKVGGERKCCFPRQEDAMRVECWLPRQDHPPILTPTAPHIPPTSNMSKSESVYI